jgi:hypothetical protein
MTPDKIPSWALFLGFLLIIIVGGYLGELDYRDQRSDECYLQGKDYNESADICINQVRSK